MPFVCNILLTNVRAEKELLTSYLAPNSRPVGLVQLGYRLEFAGVLGQERALLEQGQEIVKALLSGELFDLREQAVVRNAVQRVLNPLGLRGG